MNIIDALAASLGSAEQDAVKPTGLVAARSARSTATILQLSQFPVSIDTAIYKNALSNSNPGGDRKPLFAFRELVDPVPTFSRSYSPSANSVESVYETLLFGASIEGESAFTATLLSEARERFQSESIANLDGPGTWRAVYAVPEDWHAAKADRFKKLKIDLEAQQGSGGPFTTIGGDENLELRTGRDDAESRGLSSETKLYSIEMEYMLVGLRRPWLNAMLFDAGDWFLSGQDAGFCSSGDSRKNNGVLPLIPTGLLLGRSVGVSADWSNDDAALMNSAASAGRSLFLGPFMLSSPDIPSSTLQVIGWTCDLVPFSPRITRESAGSILVDNAGAFVTRFSVEWNEGADRRSQQSGNFPVLAAKRIGIPVHATKIVVTIEIMTFPRPFETWKTVAVYPFEKPIVKKYGLSGTTIYPSIQET